MKKENSAIRNNCLLDICETTSGTRDRLQMTSPPFWSFLTPPPPPCHLRSLFNEPPLKVTSLFYDPPLAPYTIKIFLQLWTVKLY